MNTRTFLAALIPAALLTATPVLAAEAAAPTTLTDAQRDEVRALVREVMADAGQRGTFASGMLAGIDEKGVIFLKSEDDKYQLNLKGRIEFRYIFNSQNDRAPGTTTDGGDTVEGFQLRRAQLWFNGHIGSPKIKYEFMIAADRDAGGYQIADANMHYEMTDTLAVKFGKFKQPFAREELISSGNQLMVDRSAVLEMYTLDRGNAVQLEYAEGQIFGRLAVHSGGNTESQTSFHNEPVDYAVASRWELLAMGTQKDMVDNVALTDGRKSGLLFGAAVDFEKINPGVVTGPVIAAGKTTGLTPDASIESVVSYTGDVTYKVANWAFNVAGFGSTATGVPGMRDYRSWGTTISADYRVNEAWDIFAHWQMADDGHYKHTTGGSDDDRLYSVSVGANYRVNSRLRITGDVAYYYDTNNLNFPYPLNGDPHSSGLGNLKTNNGSDDQIVARIQAQLQF